MPDNIFFSRDTRLFLVQGSNIWEIPLLNGFSFTQGANTSEITLAEMTDAAGNSRRGRAAFTDSQAPADWSFDTYVRPTLIGGLHRAVEEPLWANFVAKNAYTPEVGGATPSPATWAAGVTIGAATLDFNLLSSNKNELGIFDLVFVQGATTTATSFDPAAGSGVAGRAYGVTMYRLYDASINEVTITFDIDGIATLGWSGNSSRMREYTAVFDVTGAIRRGIDQTNNFIRNRLTQLTAVRTLDNGTTKTYGITLTGGSITLTNNISYLTPELIGRVNTPLGHITGTRAVGGSFTCYLDTTANGSSDLLEDLTNDTTSIRNRFDLDFFVGGASGTANTPRSPGVLFSFPRSHINIPSLDTGDVIALGMDFTALPSDMGTANEMDLLRYVGVAP